ncbi:MAG: glycosyltransferase [Caldilineaceae bacterium]|nr:glycosyltransferase [Caldilineaceae bacterium]
MKLSAFVVTFNRPATLASTLQTLLAQSRPPDAILVLDNSSLASVQRVAQEYAEQGVVYHDMGRNGGSGRRGRIRLDRLSREGSDWIFWGDDDDPPKSTDTLERLVSLVGRAAPMSPRWARWAENGTGRPAG